LIIDPLRRAGGLATAAVVLCFVPSRAHAQQQFQLLASLVDGIGAPVVTLQPDDIHVLENGVAAKILKVESVTFPVKLQLLVDNGVGLGSDNISHLRNGVRGLLEGLPAGVEVTLVATAAQPHFLVRATTDRAAILKGLGLLAPDGGAGKFVESLNEATQRIEKDKGDSTPVIVVFATTAGERNVLDRDVERLSQRLQARPTPVYVVLLSLLGTRSATGGANQTEIGINIAKMTGGRFETIATPIRLATLLPEIGMEVAKIHESQARQFRITVERPAGASGDLANVTMGAQGGMTVTSVSLAVPPK
jgi:VWA domain-containing protein